MTQFAKICLVKGFALVLTHSSGAASGPCKHWRKYLWNSWDQIMLVPACALAIWLVVSETSELSELHVKTYCFSWIDAFFYFHWFFFKNKLRDRKKGWKKFSHTYNTWKKEISNLLKCKSKDLKAFKSG